MKLSVFPFRRRKDSSFKGEESGGIARHLRKSQHALRSLRCRVGCTWCTLAVLAGLAFEVAFWWAEKDHHRSLFEDVLTETLFVTRLFLFSLAPLADDVKLMRGVLLLDTCLIIPPRFIYLLTYGFGEDPPQVAFLISVDIRGLIFAVVATWSACAPEPWKVQERMWITVRVYLVLNMLEKIVWFFYKCLAGSSPDKYGQLLPDLLLLYVTFRPQLRTGMQQQLWKWLERRALCKGAASLACIMGNCHPSEVIAQAKLRFKCVSLEHISFDLLASNSPSLVYGSFSQACTLGECDAFVSHSWHDDPRAKWIALQKWRQAFFLEHGREPLVWFDKCCIDQNQIEVDLRCLPIFLNGCSRVVVLCGPTYLTRLWCILELFTYMHLGRAIESIEVELVLREGAEDEDGDDIDAAFENFDVQHCQCTCPEDKHRMFTIIETAYGSMQRFNAVVQSITHEVYPQVQSRLPSLTKFPSTRPPTRCDWETSSGEDPRTRASIQFGRGASFSV